MFVQINGASRMPWLFHLSYDPSLTIVSEWACDLEVANQIGAW